MVTTKLSFTNKLTSVSHMDPWEVVSTVTFFWSFWNVWRISMKVL